MKEASREKFYLVTLSTFERLRDANLTAAEWRLWMYLALQEGNELTSAEIMEQCQMSKSKYHLAKAKFKELGLMTVERKTEIIVQRM